MTVHCSSRKKISFQISLAEWSLHNTLESGKMNNLDFPRVAKTIYHIDAIDLVNTFFQDKAQDTVYLEKLKKECNKYGVKCLLIMIDDEGQLADTNNQARDSSVIKHYKWVKAAKYLGCHSIRVNAVGDGDNEKMKKGAIESITKLCDFAAKYNINIIIENHWVPSCDPDWVKDIIQSVNRPNCGSLPDPGNFDKYDIYKGIETLLPYAKSVSAKSLDFDKKGNETTINYEQLLTILSKTNYQGYLGIEYDGERLSEHDGIIATRDLLLKLSDLKE